MSSVRKATLLAGIPAANMSLFHRIRFSVMDPAAVIELPNGAGATERTLLLRDIEMGRARLHASADHVHCPDDFAPAGGLSGDRATATAQAAAECLRRAGVTVVMADGSLPLLYIHTLQEAGIEIEYDPELGIAERRSKDAEEVLHLLEAQRVTEQAVRMGCETVARATAGGGGVLHVDGEPLTSERLRARINLFLIERGYESPVLIVAGGPQGADCHDVGSGPLRTGEPVIIDVFPRNTATFYWGDCTRTVVHGTVSTQLAKMRDAVAAAKAAAIAAVRPGATGEAVHEATVRTLSEHGFKTVRPTDEVGDDECVLVHGTGHGVGLEVHEPPLLDRGGPELVVGDVVTVEPALYSKAIGGLRIEDMVVVTEDGCENLNRLPETLSW